MVNRIIKNFQANLSIFNPAKYLKENFQKMKKFLDNQKMFSLQLVEHHMILQCPVLAKILRYPINSDNNYMNQSKGEIIIFNRLTTNKRAPKSFMRIFTRLTPLPRLKNIPRIIISHVLQMK